MNPTLADLHRSQLALHAELRHQIAALASAVATLDSRVAAAAPRARPAPQADAAIAVQLLPLLFARWPRQVFVAGEVLALVDIDRRIGQALQPLIDGGGDPGKRLGRMLKRCAGQPFGGYALNLVRPTSPLLFEVVFVTPSETP